MANGLQGIPENRWSMLEKPLLSVDPLLAGFAKAAGGTLTKNDHGEVERSIRFVEADGVRRKLQVFLADEEKLTFRVWAVAAEDRNDGRYWREKILATISAPFQPEEIQNLLREGRELLEGWKKRDLKKAG